MEPKLFSFFADVYEDGLEEIASYDLGISRQEITVRNRHWISRMVPGSPVSIALLVDQSVYKRDRRGAWQYTRSDTRSVYYEAEVYLKFRDVQPANLMMGPELFASILEVNANPRFTSSRLLMCYPAVSEIGLLTLDKGIELSDEDLSPSEPSP